MLGHNVKRPRLISLLVLMGSKMLLMTLLTDFGSVADVFPWAIIQIHVLNEFVAVSVSGLVILGRIVRTGRRKINLDGFRRELSCLLSFLKTQTHLTPRLRPKQKTNLPQQSNPLPTKALLRRRHHLLRRPLFCLVPWRTLRLILLAGCLMAITSSMEDRIIC